MSSSKLFIRTKRKFWLDDRQRIPQAIQTDELTRAVYYPGAKETHTSPTGQRGCLCLD